MNKAASLADIKQRLQKALPRTVITSHKEPVPEMSFMTSQTMNRPVRYQVVRSEEKRDSKLIGILLCHPQATLAKSEIIGHLPFFHVRSGEAIDFFCAGYGAYWPPEDHVDREVITKIEGKDWLFSNEAFNQVIEELEEESSWTYSGETELILLPAYLDSNGEPNFDYTSSIVCNLEAMNKDEAFTSVRAFFDNIFKYAKRQSSTNPTWDFSDKRGMKVAEGVLKEFIVSLLPKPLRAGYSKASHYAIKNIATDF